MEGREALVKLAAGRLSLHSPWRPVLARIETACLRDSGRNAASSQCRGGSKFAASERGPTRQRLAV